MKRVACIKFGGLALGCLLLTGCVDQSYRMIGRECVQVAKYEPSVNLMKQYLTSVTLYEGYQTRAHFDVLVMSDSIRALSAALRARKQGLSSLAASALLAQYLAEGETAIQLYVLTQIADQAHVSLSAKDSAWSLYITTPTGRILRPRTIKEVDLSPEIRSLFGYRFLPFKKAYEVSFAATDLAGERYLKAPDVAVLTLAGAGMSSTIRWRVEAGPEAGTHGEELLKRQDNKSLWEVIKSTAAARNRDDDYYFC